jgi:hypothetical protein
MSASKIISTTVAIIFFLGIYTLDCAVAGEKVKAHGASFTVKFEQMEVGDEEGHVIAIYEQKQIYISEITGDKTSSTTIGFMDLNTKTGEGSGKGYGVTYYKDGDKTFRSWEGKSVGPGHWQGTYKVIKGTGKYEGIKGGGNWDSYYVAPQQSYMEVEGEFEIPTQ